jgi:hypothetical protein
LSSKTDDLKAIEDLTMERWDLVEGFLKGEQNAIDWANDYPIEKLVRWGVDE